MNISATNSSSLSSCSCCHNNGSDSSLDSYYYCFHCAILATATIESTRSCSSISDYNENNNDDDEERGIIISSSISSSSEYTITDRGEESVSDNSASSTIKKDGINDNGDLITNGRFIVITPRKTKII